MKKILLSICLISTIMAHAGNINYKVYMAAPHPPCYHVKGELLSIDFYSENNDISPYIDGRAVGHNIAVLIRKDDLIQTITFPLLEKKTSSYFITDESEKKNNIYLKWLYQK